MLAGAVTAFAVAFPQAATRGRSSPPWPLLMALIFGVLTLTLVSNQVATGLALTLFGLGLSALLGAGFVGSPIQPCRSSPSPACRPSRSSARSCSVRTPWSTSPWR